MQITNWSFEDNGYALAVRGSVHGNAYFGDGDEIITAGIQNINIDLENKRLVVTTDVKTEYILEFKDINAELFEQSRNTALGYIQAVLTVTLLEDYVCSERRDE